MQQNAFCRGLFGRRKLISTQRFPVTANAHVRVCETVSTVNSTVVWQITRGRSGENHSHGFRCFSLSFQVRRDRWLPHSSCRLLGGVASIGPGPSLGLATRQRPPCISTELCLRHVSDRAISVNDWNAWCTGYSCTSAPKADAWLASRYWLSIKFREIIRSDGRQKMWHNYGELQRSQEGAVQRTRWRHRYVEELQARELRHFPFLFFSYSKFFFQQCWLWRHARKRSDRNSHRPSKTAKSRFRDSSCNPFQLWPSHPVRLVRIIVKTKTVTRDFDAIQNPPYARQIMKSRLQKKVTVLINKRRRKFLIVRFECSLNHKAAT